MGFSPATIFLLPLPTSLTLIEKYVVRQVRSKTYEGESELKAEECKLVVLEFDHLKKFKKTIFRDAQKWREGNIFKILK
jgi:hypothetical protein